MTFTDIDNLSERLIAQTFTKLLEIPPQDEDSRLDKRRAVMYTGIQWGAFLQQYEPGCIAATEEANARYLRSLGHRTFGGWGPTLYELIEAKHNIRDGSR